MRLIGPSRVLIGPAGSDYDDWVCDQLSEVMAAAAETWIAFHHDLFRGGLE